VDLKALTLELPIIKKTPLSNNFCTIGPKIAKQKPGTSSS
jgi:hypothetical protein